MAKEGDRFHRASTGIWIKSKSGYTDRQCRNTLAVAFEMIRGACARFGFQLPRPCIHLSFATNGIVNTIVRSCVHAREYRQRDCTALFQHDLYCLDQCNTASSTSAITCRRRKPTAKTYADCRCPLKCLQPGQGSAIASLVRQPQSLHYIILDIASSGPHCFNILRGDVSRLHSRIVAKPLPTLSHVLHIFPSWSPLAI